MSGTLSALSARLGPVLGYPLLDFGRTRLTLSGLALLILLAALVLAAERRVRQHVVARALRRTRLDPALQYTIGQIAGYLFVALGWYVALQVVGIDLTSLAVMAGAVGVGVGFGLQHVVSNFVSGVIILAERPISVGDRIEVAGVAGQVVKISLRSTTVITNDNIAVIVPNASLVTNSVTNWSHGDPKVRFRIPVTVAIGADLEAVKALLLEVAAAHPHALREPEPAVFCTGFGDAGLNLELAVWTVAMARSPRRFRSDLNFAVVHTLRSHGIALPAPRRDVYLVAPAGDGQSSAVQPAWE